MSGDQTAVVPGASGDRQCSFGQTTNDQETYYGVEYHETPPPIPYHGTRTRPVKYGRLLPHCTSTVFRPEQSAVSGF